MEIIIEILLELVVQIIGEGIGELVIRSIGSIFGEKFAENKFLPFLGYIFFGGVLGCISLAVLPEHMIKDPQLRLVNLFLSPLVLGLLMLLRGKNLKAKEAKVIRLDSLLYGFIFAFSISIVRFKYGR